ncbi:hypothetical protein [Leuconostoc citreum]
MAFKYGSVESNGRILTWNGNSIAVSKINSVDVHYDKRTFPLIAVGFIIIGLLMLKGATIISLICIVIGGLWIYWWYNHRVFDYTVRLRTSSTEPFVLPFGNNVAAAVKVRDLIIHEIDILQ